MHIQKFLQTSCYGSLDQKLREGTVKLVYKSGHLHVENNIPPSSLNVLMSKFSRPSPNYGERGQS